MQPKASDLIRSTFDVAEEGIYVERNGVAVRGTRPGWLDWPCVRGDEFAAQDYDPSVLAEASRIVSRGARK